MGRTSAGKQSFPAKHERFRSSHFRERVVSLHGESGGLKIRRERVGTVTTHLAPWSIGKDAYLRFATVVAIPRSPGPRATLITHYGFVV